MFDPQKGVNPSLSVSVLFLGFQSNGLFTGVAPTTCSLTICSYYLYGEGFYAVDRRNSEGFYAEDGPMW